MTISQGERLYGFTVTRVRENSELGGRLVELTHDKTGGEVCWVDNGETNKLFSIAFKTLPEDSTGVFHILEHSVLCGSEKYPVREPFVELLKSSMNTFLNAFTGSEFTMYPVSSRIEQDYMNLMSVYLDAVFAPRLLRDPNIFYQEGRHIEQNDGVLSYKGVVFNEMKGAMSSEDRVGEQKLMSMIYRDNSYGFNSGGDPEVIPSLTYEKYVETYKRFYHPSNARVFLDGAVPVKKTLEMLGEYFSRFERLETLPEVVMQQPVSGEESIFYAAPEGESLENKELLMMGRIIETWQDRVKALAAMALCDALAGSNEAPLKRAVLVSALAQNLSLNVEASSAQMTVNVTAKGVQDGKGGELKALIQETARQLAAEGLSRTALEASINRLEFRLREPEEPQGLMRAINALSTWMFGGDPMAALTQDEAFRSVRAMLAGDAFEALLREMLVEEEGLNVLTMKPSAALGEETRRREAEKLAALAASWTEKDWAENRALNEALTKWQETPDTAEALSSIPQLSLDQVSEEVEFTPTEERLQSGVKVLYHPVPCRGIVHFNLYFALTDCELDELTRLQLLQALLGKLPTRRHDALELQQLIKNDIGRLEFGLTTTEKKGEAGECTPCLAVYCSVLRDKLPRAAELIVEILTETDFGQRDRIRETVMQRELVTTQTGVSAGHALGISAVMAHASARGAVMEAVSGYSMIQGIHALARDFEGHIEETAALFARFARETVCRARLTASVTAEEEADLSALFAALPAGTPVAAARAYRTALPERMGVRIPAQISFAVQGESLSRLGCEFDASALVSANIMTYSYLWNQVRVQGGAYGTGMRVGMDGRTFTYSYRDPTPARSLNVNGGMADFIAEFCASDETLDKYIISSIADTEPLRSPREKGVGADTNWFSGYSREDFLAMRRRMLRTNKGDVLAFAEAARRFAEKAPVCVVGYADALREIPELTVFDI